MFVRQMLYPLLILLQPVSTNLVSEQLSSQPATTRAIDYLPLKTGNVWRYNVISGSATNPTRQLIETVMSAEAGSQKQITFTLRVEDYSVPKSEWPDEPTEFTLRANGDIFCDKCAGYLLKAPLEPSATWIAAQDDERAEVSRIVGRPTTVKLNGKFVLGLPCH